MSSVEIYGADKPKIGLIKNGKQHITIMDKHGVSREYVSTPEKIDEFVKASNKLDKDTTRNGWISTLSGTALGGVVGWAKCAKKPTTKPILWGCIAGFALGTLIDILFIGGKKADKQDFLAQEFIKNNTY